MAKIHPIMENGDVADLELAKSVVSSSTRTEILDYNCMLTFSDKNTLRDYRTYQKSTVNWPTLLVGLGIYFFITLTRASLSRFFQLGLIFNFAHAIFILVCCLFCTFFSAQYCLVYRPENCYWYKCSRYAIYKWLDGHIEDVLISATALLAGLYLFARVTADPCPTGMNGVLISQESCNPDAGNNELPHDQELLLQMTPFVIQLYFQGVSRWGIMISSIITLLFLAASVAYVPGNSGVWSIVYALFFLHMCYECQRVKMEGFLHSKRITEQESELLEREIEHRKQLIQLANKASQFETEQLRSIYGNVAHDLKTPIQSIAVGIENIKTNFVTVPKDCANRRAGSVMMEAHTLLDVMSASCTFMLMAINRAIDFTKSSSDRNLVPNMSSFNVASDMMLPISCIKCLQTDVSIVTKVASECLYKTSITSDQHWFCENILCLLSNAVKYSDGGVVTVQVEVTDQPSPAPSREEMDVPDSASVDDFKSSEKLNNFKKPRLCLGLSFGNGNGNSSASFLSRQERFVMVSVEDNGIGVSRDVADGLFKPANLADRKSGGMGLGLFSLQQRIDALGGRCGVMERADGKAGSLFWFSFPYRPDSSSSSGVPESPSAAAARTALAINSNSRRSMLMSSGGPAVVLPSNLSTPLTNRSKHASFLTILLVDDSLPILKMIQATLEKMGHQVITAKNGAKALAEMKRLVGGECDASELDVVLMDLQMPVMDGFEATRLFREYEAALPSSEPPRFVNHLRDTSISIPINFINPAGQADDSDLILSAARSAALAYAGVNHSNGGSGLRASYGYRSRHWTSHGNSHGRRRLPIIGMSANSDVGTKENAIAAGMDHFMPKPFSMKEFELLVHQFRL